MYHNIKNFSELTAINTNRALKVDFKLRKYGRTVSQIMVNGYLVTVDNVVFEFDLFDPINLEIDLIDFDEGTSGIEVVLNVNELEVLPKYQHLCSSGNNYVDKKGIWNLNIPKNFYMWYHEISGQGFIA